MADVLHPRQASRVPIGWDETGQGYRAPTLRVSAVDNEFEMRVHDADLAAALTGGGLVDKTLLVDGSVNVAVVGSVTVALVDLQEWPFVWWCLKNTGANATDSGYLYTWASVEAHSSAHTIGVLAPGARTGAQCLSAQAGSWVEPARSTHFSGRWARFIVGCAAGTTVALDVMGMRY